MTGVREMFLSKFSPLQGIGIINTVWVFTHGIMGFCVPAVDTGTVTLLILFIKYFHFHFLEPGAGNMKYSWSIQYLLIDVRPVDGVSINRCILFLYNAIRLIEQIITISLIIYAFACCGRD